MPSVKRKKAIQLSDIAAMELREREGYLRHPQSVEESLIWEEQAVWPAEEGESIPLNPSAVSQKFVPEEKEEANADSSLTTPKLKDVWGPVRSE
jgi:hypothetical protein